MAAAAVRSTLVHAGWERCAEGPPAGSRRSGDFANGVLGCRYDMSPGRPRARTYSGQRLRRPSHQWHSRRWDYRATRSTADAPMFPGPADVRKVANVRRLADFGACGVSCWSFVPMSARRVTLEIFPTWVRGSAPMTSRRSGHLYLARPSASRYAQMPASVGGFCGSRGTM